MTVRSRDDVWVRRMWSVGIVAAVAIALPLLAGHRGTHMALNLVLPGAGLFGVDVFGAVAIVVAAVAAFTMWMRWGMDWTVVVVLAGAVVVSGLAIHDHATVASAMPAMRSSHEFPLVLLVASALTRLERVIRRFPPIAWLGRRRAAQRSGWSALGALAPVARCRAASIAALAGPVEAPVVAAVGAADVVRRAHRVGVAARARVGGEPLRIDHAHARTALALTGQLDDAALDALCRDAAATAVGVPCSEPGWVRLLDASLTAAVLHRLGAPQAVADLERLLADELRLKRGHRPAAWWTILGVRSGPAAPWEQAAATAIARALGALDDDADWVVLRRRAFGAAARGTRDHHDERLVAAARIWLVFADDPAAVPIIERPTVGHDPLAIALDRLATALRVDPDLLRRQPAHGEARHSGVRSAA